MPDELAERCDVLYLYNAQQCGLSVSDLQALTYDQAMGIIEAHEFVSDAVEHAEEDEQALRGEAAFFA